MIPGKTLCSYLACLVVFVAMAGLELFNPPAGEHAAAYVWPGALGVAGVLLLVAWLRREDARQWRLATAIWFVLVAASFLA